MYLSPPQLSAREVSGSQAELRVTTLQSRVTELESLQHASTSEAKQLKQDKVLLVEHVAELQTKVGRSLHYISLSLFLNISPSLYLLRLLTLFPYLHPFSVQFMYILIVIKLYLHKCIYIFHIRIYGRL